jgi:hypothetical protein
MGLLHNIARSQYSVWYKIAIANPIWQRYADTARFLPTKTLKPEVAWAEGAGKPV